MEGPTYPITLIQRHLLCPATPCDCAGGLSAKCFIKGRPSTVFRRQAVAIFQPNAMISNNASLSALVTLIGDATSVVEAHFKASAKPYVPSLEDTEEHPLDVKLYSPELRKAVQTIEGACAQLCATVVKPSHSIVTVSVITSRVLGSLTTLL